MTRKFKALLILFVTLAVVAGVVLFVLLKPARWSQEIVTYLNQSVLKDNGWTLTIESLDGRFTSDVYLKNLYLRKKDGSATVFSEKARVNLDFSRILTGDWAISDLSLEDGFITVRTGGEGDRSGLAFVDKLTSHGFHIRDLNLTNTSVIVQSGSRENLYSFDFGGEVTSRGRSLSFVPERVRVTDVGNRRTFEIGDGEIDLTDDQLSVRDVKGRVNGVPVELDGSVTFSTPVKWVINGTGKGVALSPYLDRVAVDIVKIDTADVRFEVKSDPGSSGLQAWLFPSGGDSVLGHVSLEVAKEGEDLELKRALVSLRSSRLTGGGMLRKGRQLFLQMGIDGLDLSDFGLPVNATSIRGSVNVTGTLEGRDVEELMFVLDLANGEPGTDRYVRAEGQLTYANEKVRIDDSLRLDLGYGTLLATGEIDLNKERVDLAFTPSNVDLEAVGYLVGVDSLKGVTAGALEVVGYLRDPIANGYLTFKDARFGRLFASSLEASFRVNSVFGRPQGILRAVATGGRIGEYSVEDGTADVYFRGDTLLVEGLRLTAGTDFLQASGRIVGSRSLRVNQIQLSLGEHYVTSLGPVVVERRPDGVEVRPALFQINEGRARVSFALTNGRLSSGDVSLENLNLATLWKVTDRDIPLAGTAFARVSARTDGDTLRADGKVEIRDGSWRDIEFDHLLMTGAVDENVMDVREFRVMGPHDLNVKLSGFAGIKGVPEGRMFEVDPLGPVGFSGEFRNVQLELLSALWPRARILGGSATGSLMVSGIAGSPDMVFEFTVRDPRLDRINGRLVSVSGRYTDRRLYIEDMEAETETGSYSANGYLPVDLAFGSRSPGWAPKQDPVSMTFHGETSRLTFLTPYLSSVDSVSGDIDFDLTISGTPADPVRNGRIQVKNGTVYAFHLDSPIEHVNGNAVLKNNQLIIDELVASSDVPPKMD
ncbi:MAG: hypothetical protein ACE5LH_07905, partial [Fidelibacterota bacterium]